MTKPASVALIRFERSLASNGGQGEVTYDLTAFEELVDEERSSVVALLVKLAEDGDLRAIETLASALATEAVPAVRALAHGVGLPEALVATAARALFALTGESLPTVAEATKSADTIQASFSAYELRRVQGTDAIMGLLGAL